MDWATERWVKVYTRDTVTWALLCWQAKCTFLLILRKADRAGVVDLPSHIPPAVVLSKLLDMPLEVVEPGFEDLCASGVIELQDGAIVVPNFVEAQETPSSDTKRKAEYRARQRRDSKRANTRVTPGDAVSHDVPSKSRDVPPEPSRAEPSRAEPTKIARARVADPVPEPHPPPQKIVFDVGTQAHHLHQRILDRTSSSATLQKLGIRAPKPDHVPQHLGQGRREEDVWRAVKSMLDRIEAGKCDGALKFWRALWSGDKCEYAMGQELKRVGVGVGVGHARPEHETLEQAQAYAKTNGGKAPTGWQNTWDGKLVKNPDEWPQACEVAE
jgi:hypothetical protein